MTTTFLAPKNNANSKLSAALAIDALSMSVLAGEGARFPSTFPYHLTVDNEIIRVTARTTDTMTIVRAQESTVAAAHVAGATVQLNITAQVISDLNTAVNTLEGANPTFQGSDGVNVSVEVAQGQPPVVCISADMTEIKADTDIADAISKKHSIDHKASHQDGGSDEVSIAGLSGQAADAQKFRSGGSTMSSLDFAGDGLIQTGGEVGGGGALTVTISHKDISARVTHNANQSIANTTSVALAFNTEIYDTDTIHDNSTNNSRLTCKTAGLYHIQFNGAFAASAAGIRFASIVLNGTTTIANISAIALGAGGRIILYIATDYVLAVNDYVEVVVYQDSGTAQNLDAASAFSPIFSMTKLA
jgi:hypothetical protein